MPKPPQKTSEGKLKERINELAKPEINMGITTSVPINRTEIFKLLDEAKKDFPKKHWDGFQWVYEAEEIDFWLKTWFNLKPTLRTYNVVGRVVTSGCAGHIDSAKLQDIEKEE